ncbi:MAG: hypothetical protein ACRCYU_07110 [Nocardioides sp.]
MARADYALTLARGAYPESHHAPDHIRSHWIDSYLQGIIGRDLPELRREVRPTRAMALLRTLAGRQSAELVKAKLAHETALPPSTITGYLDLRRTQSRPQTDPATMCFGVGEPPIRPPCEPRQRPSAQDRSGHHQRMPPPPRPSHHAIPMLLR